MAAPNGEYETTIGPDAAFKGEIIFDKGLCVMGRFEGQIKTKGKLHVAEGASVRADVDAGSVEIDGEVKGNLTASKRIQLSSSSKLEGDLRTSRLEVADGAVFVGNCQVGPRDSTKPGQTGETKTAEAGKKAASHSGGTAAAKK